jgi:Protein of unknown function (DUF3604)
MTNARMPQIQRSFPRAGSIPRSCQGCRDALCDPTPQVRLSGKVASGMDLLKTGPSGLGGVWAEENTRESLFAAMQRKEVFGTSGVRIKVRMFGSWSDFEELKLL